jgi:hypothetical protein
LERPNVGSDRRKPAIEQRKFALVITVNRLLRQAWDARVKVMHSYGPEVRF